MVNCVEQEIEFPNINVWKHLFNFGKLNFLNPFPYQIKFLWCPKVLSKFHMFINTQLKQKHEKRTNLGPVP
jgi:hypothetical protein